MTGVPVKTIGPEAIAAIERIIRPHIRRTPVVEADGAGFGFAPARLTLKLELLQHAGSFKTRGAFANLLTRRVPQAGVVAASGGNHGAAVAYAAMKLGVHAICVRRTAVSSPIGAARIDRGRHLAVVSRAGAGRRIGAGLTGIADGPIVTIITM